MVRVAGSCVLLVLLSMSTAQDCHAQKMGSERFLRWVSSDLAGLARSSPRGGPIIAAGMAGVIFGSALLDADMNDRVRRYTPDDLDGFLNQANRLGGPEATWPVVGLFGVSLLTDNRRFQDAAFTSLESLLLAGAISYGIKSAVGRLRPHDGGNPQRFDPLSGFSSFPSGHTTTAFAIVTPWLMYYPGIFSYSLLVVAGGTATARLHRDKHWATDVVAGALLGASVARFLARRHGATGSRAARSSHPRRRANWQIAPGKIAYRIRFN